VLVVVLSGREVVTTGWAESWRTLIFPERANRTFLYGMPFDHARNQGCQRTLETEHEGMFFLDDDVILPHDTIVRLMRHNKDIVGGLYYRRQLPPAPVMMRETEKGPEWIHDYQPGRLVEADLVGCGCLLIKRKVLEIMPPPWFEWKCDPYRWPDLKPVERCSEDYDFCRKARALGFKLYVDTSIQCHHAGLSVASAQGFTPLQLP
jgi:hypothetical protein